jgi:hypothetical protein
MDFMKAFGTGALGLFGLTLGWGFSKHSYLAIPVNSLAAALLSCLAYYVVRGSTFAEAYLFTRSIELWFLIPGTVIWLIEVVIKRVARIRDDT